MGCRRTYVLNKSSRKKYDLNLLGIICLFALEYETRSPGGLHFNYNLPDYINTGQQNIPYEDGGSNPLIQHNKDMNDGSKNQVGKVSETKFVNDEQDTLSLNLSEHNLLNKLFQDKKVNHILNIMNS